MADIAQIGFAAETAELERAKATIKSLVPAAKDAEGGADKLSRSLDKVNAAAGKAANGSSKAEKAMHGAATGAKADATAVDKLATSSRRGTSAIQEMAEAINRESAALNAAAGATTRVSSVTGTATINTHGFANALDLAAMAGRRLEATSLQAKVGVQNLGLAIQQASRGQKLMAREGLNLSRQFADIGVTAAMGMNPLMIAIQQGPQLLDIFQEKALITGTTIRASMASTAAAIWGAMLPLMPIILGIGLAVGVITGAFALFNRSVTRGLDDVSRGMGLTEKQLERLAESGVETGVTMGDTFKAAFQIIAEDALAVLKPMTDAIGSWWSTMLDDLTTNTANEIKAILGFFIGTYRAVVATWQNFPAVFSDLVAMGSNMASRHMNDFVKNSVKELNFLIRAWNLWATITGNPGRLGELDAPGPMVTNRPTTGAAADVAAAYASGQADADGYVDGWAGRVRQRATELRQAAIREAAGDADTGSERNRSAREKKDPYAELIAGARENLFMLKEEESMIGMVGQALEVARYETDMLAQARQADITLTAAQTAEIRDLAEALGEQAAANERLYFMDELRVSSGERIAGLREELSYIGMNADAVTRLRIENELLAQARQANINLTPADIAAIKGIASEQATVENAIRRTSEALEFNRSAVRGFVGDLRAGLTQGKSLWESFGNAVVNVLNKIIERMSDRMIDMFFDNMGGKGGSSGGSWWKVAGSAIMGALRGSAKGNAFGSPAIDAFAKGGDFTNGIVNRPTLFRYAKGAKMGEMGEAGPEAIMPLKRGADGSLGVQMHGGSGSRVINAPVTVNQSITLTGAMSSQDVINTTRQAAEQSKQEVKRSLVGWLNQYEQDGAIS